MLTSEQSNQVKEQIRNQIDSTFPEDKKEAAKIGRASCRERV